MQDIKSILHHYTFVFDFVNILELIFSLLLLIPAKRKWHDYILCLYGGFLFGIIPFFVFFENIFAALIGSVFVSLTLVLLHRKLETKLYIPLEIFLCKALLIVGILFFEGQYLSNKFNLYLLLMLASFVAFLIINIFYEFPTEKQNYIIKLFALLELSGAILQIYRNDYVSFAKDLYDNDIKGSVSLFLYLLKVDFDIFDYQYLYIMIFCSLSIIYLLFVNLRRIMRNMSNYRK